MEAKDLRIGNFLEHDKSYFYINCFLGKDVVDLELIGFEYTDNNHNANISDCKPIPLTKEWLLKFGFEKYNEHWFRLGKIWIDIRDGIICFGEEFKQVNLNFCCKNVHKLQNAVFILTGRELKYKK